MKKYLLTFVALPFLFTAPFAALPFSCTSLRDAGVFRSADAGESWEQAVRISKNQTIASIEISTIKIDPLDSKIIYLGTRGAGLFKTMDGGDTWYRLNETNQIFTKRANVYSIAIDSKNTANIYIGTYQDRYGRVFRSPDGGRNWEEVYRVSQEQYAIFAVELDVFDPSVIYIGTAEGGFFRSADYGKSWKPIKWFGDVISGIKINPFNTQIIYVSTFNGGIFKTTDKGQSWQKLESLNSFSQAQQLEMLVMDNNNPEILYVASPYGLLKSLDSGANWQAINIAIPPQAVSVQAVALDPINSASIYYSAGNIFYQSKDGGLTWAVRPIATSKKIKTIAVDPKNPSVIYLGIQQ